MYKKVIDTVDSSIDVFRKVLGSEHTVTLKVLEILNQSKI